MTRYLVTATIYAVVTINNPEVVERITGPGGDEWRSRFYGDMLDAEDVVEHFAFNAICHGVHDITRLDGWADCDEGDVTIEIDDCDFYTEPRDDPRPEPANL